MVVQETPQQKEGAKAPPKAERKHRLKQRFEVVKKLGQGTYGKVQLAINKETGQEVAIKTIKKAKIESEQDLIRIRREIQIMSSIQHPHIIHIYEVFENREKIVLVMQYASGGELYEYVSDKKLLSDIEARRLFRQIAAAVYYCHKNKICHRDLKLENILLDEKGNAKIADFGLSNVFDERHLLNTFCGSPLYASPEIVKGSPYYGPEVDCWSMGVLLYTLVYGAMPFDGSNFKRLVRQISEGDYYEPKKKSDASGLIRRLLTVNPVKRATIIDICTEWWVNIGYEHSLLQVAEDMANLTPVRLDLLLALAPVSPPPQEIQEPPLTQAQPPRKKDSIPQEEPSVSYPEDNEDAGEDVSNSFAYVQEFENSNDNGYYQENEGSEEEFLPASLAAELEGRSAKRPAEKSFDGSMMRISSLAHKSKKPKKSESIQNAAKVPGESKDKIVNIPQQKSQSKVIKQKISSSQDSEPNIPVQSQAAATESSEKAKPSTTDTSSQATPVTKENEQEQSLQNKEMPKMEEAKINNSSADMAAKEEAIKEDALQTEMADSKAAEAIQENEKEEMPPSPDDEKPQLKSTRSASLGGRRPGKIAIPKFLESPPGLPTQPSDKKTVKLSRAVSDAKKMFEAKNQGEKRMVIIPSLKVADARRAFEQPVTDSGIPANIFRKTSSPAVLVSTSAHELLKSQKEISNEEKSEADTEINKVEEKISEKEVCAEASQDTGTTKTDKEVRTVSDQKANSDGTIDVREKAEQQPKKDVNDEQKKNAAKGILKKTIARARLVEKRLSQQSSQESESGSVTPPTPTVGATTPSSDKVTTPSFFRPPRPFVKEEEQESKVQSKAEIVLNKKSEEVQSPKIKVQEKGRNELPPEEESIWGPGPPVPTTPPVNVHTTHTAMIGSYDNDISNSESESNWKHTVEESLRRLSPEGASEEQNFQQNAHESANENAGPVPIARSYKKFTFTRDGACITETGEIYTAPSSDGTWTKVEKKTKVTRHPSQGEGSDSPRIRNTPPLGRSDSQSSSGSNDIFDDMFDSWTGDSMLGNLVNVKTVFNRLSKDPFFRRGRKKDKHRRAKELRSEWVASSAHSTDRESSDNDDDLECLFEDSRPVMYGSQGLWQFLRSINRDLPGHLRTIRSTNRQFSQERDQFSRPPTRSNIGSYTRSMSRDRGSQSPRQTVLRFVIESPAHQRLVNASEPNTPASHQREKNWEVTNRDYQRRDSGIESWMSWEPERSSRHSFSSIHSKGDDTTDRASFYGTIRPKAHQRFTKSLSKEEPESPTSGATTLHESESSNRSDNSRGVNTSESRKRRVEQWLHMTDGNEYPNEPAHGSSDSERMSIYGTIRPRQHLKYNRSASEKLVGVDGPMNSEDRSQSTQNLHNSDNSTSKPQYRTVSEIQVNSSTDSLNQSHTASPEIRMHRHGSFGSSNLHPVHEGVSGIHIEPTVKKHGRPVLQMRVSFNKKSAEPEVVVVSPKKIVNTAEHHFTTSPHISPDIISSFGHMDSSLLEALRTHGYRGVISQRFGSERVVTPPFSASTSRTEGPSQCEAEPAEPQSPEADVSSQHQQPVRTEINMRGKVEPNASSSNVDTESNACSELCMATNQPSNSCVKSNSDNANAGSEKADTEVKGQCISSEDQSSVGRGSAPPSDEPITPDENSVHGETVTAQQREKPPKSVDIGGESVSERIHRKSFYTRFNDSRPRRRRSSFLDDLLPDIRPTHVSTSSWSINNDDDSDRDSSSLPRRNSFRRSLHNVSNGPELYSHSYTRSASYLDDLMDNSANIRPSGTKNDWAYQKSESKSSQIYDELASNDELGTYRSLSRRSSFKAIDPPIRLVPTTSSVLRDSNVQTIRIPTHRLSFSQPSSFDHDYADPTLSERPAGYSSARVSLPHIDHSRYATRSQQEPVSPLDETAYQAGRRGSRFSLLGDYSDLEDYDIPVTGHAAGMEDYNDVDDVLKRPINRSTSLLQRRD